MNVGIIGCGPRSVGHMEAVDAHEGLEVIAGADPAPSGRDRFRARYDRPVYEDTAALLERERPDIVAICTREDPRYELTMAAIEERGGTHRNDADTSLKGFEIIHGIYHSAVARDRTEIPLPEGAEPLEEIMA